MGEADRHSVYIKGHNLEPRLSPFDPIALLDEIAQTVPGYSLDRINLLAGNSVTTEIGAGPGFVSVAALSGEIAPAHDTLFTSSALGRYSDGLNKIAQHQSPAQSTAAAD